MTAGSLTFTTLIALVPLLAVMLAVFTAFPMFAKFQDALQKYLLQSLVPDAIARPVIQALTQFAGKAHRVGSAGLVVLVVSALSLMLTIDRALNAIWRVRRPRPIAQRVLIYWSLATLGPVMLGFSLSLTSYAISANRGLVNALPGGVGLLLDLMEFTVQALGMAALFHYVPNTHVRWRHALAGGFFVAIGFDLAKRALAWYVGSVSSYSAIYGAFATAPIFLLWLYLGWVIVLLGAVVAAYAPSLRTQAGRWPAGAGARFNLALAVIGALSAARGTSRGLTLEVLAAHLRVDTLQVEPVLDQLMADDWVGRMEESGAQRHVLLCDPATTPALPLIDRFLIGPSPGAEPFRKAAGLSSLKLEDLLPA